MYNEGMPSACVTYLIAGAIVLATPAAAVAHTPPRHDRARISAYLEPVRVAPTAEQFDAMLTGARLAHEYAASVGWVDQCPDGQLREIHANLQEEAAEYGITVLVSGLSWYWECRWAVEADWADDPATLCGIAAHEEGHGIRADGYHETEPGTPIDAYGRTFPPCLDAYPTVEQPDPAPPTIREARRAVRLVLAHPNRWKITGRQYVSHVRLTARKRKTGTVRSYRVTYRPDGTGLLTTRILRPTRA